MSRMILDTGVYLNGQTEKYTKISPPEHLRKYVRYFWTLEGDVAGGASKIISPLADGCPGIMLQKSEQGIYFDSTKKQLPPVFLYGQTGSPGWTERGRGRWRVTDAGPQTG